ncbi:uncharacterized protein CC84DRAFT_1117220 [Paraphaeosphaeria sporulosa]|uniref:Zn(2)-C6 fungal-type domain-containing protein n=1 Tax=Paraphaeosphaeria sporulosa TaxID=1460663 RepID=A0A177CHU2_9PLEO|nr:uncharacterized protein CC84DRAFT_1117220 [Paraphaeosphaeria sporulosa]OAG07114.1 hypothetical protein CC84DRAFT_1117220 [Paraphaeosphaeria sporulosa]
MSSSAPGPSGRKVAIPRLQRTNQSQPSKERRRVGRACTACRSHKIKCTGDVPQCKHCETTGRECVYIMPRKDRLKTVTERSGQMIGLLKKLRAFANDDDGARIAELLEAAEEDMFETRHTPTISNPDTNEDELHRPGGLFEANMGKLLERLNTESLDLVDENLHETDQARATGFVGPGSEVQWLRSFLLLERGDSDAATSKRGSSANTTNNEQVSTITFYLDNKNVDPEFPVEPYELPTADVAEQLLNIYLEKVHDSFPILPRKLFQDQCQKYFEALNHGSALRLSAKWQAILNLVFAIGAKYSHLVKANWQADERDHLIYQARASAFAWNENTLGQHPDLPQIQVAGLLAFYHLSVGQVSRAWVVIGVALRFATALGLHVRNEDPSASGAKREVLVRVWWSLYYLERQLSIITGRPSAVVDSHCSVPLPVPFSEQQILENINIVDSLRRSSVTAISPIAHSHSFSEPHPTSGGHSSRSPPYFGLADANSGSYFKAVVQLCTISQSILTSLYSAGTMVRSPSDLQQDILQIGKRIDDWAANLPVNFNFQTPFENLTTPDNSTFRQRTMLAFQLCSAKILLTRPCLNSLAKSDGENKEGSSASFLRRMAIACVEAAKMEVDLLPDQPQPRFVYEFGPWWILVHHLMQALAVFLLALSYSSTMHQNNEVLAGYCAKIIRWLRAMGDSQAERAHQVAVGCYDVIAVRLSLPSTKLWIDPQVPDSGIRQDDAARAAFSAYHHPIAAEMGYGSDLAMPAYPGIAGDSAPFLYAPDPSSYYPQQNRNLCDGNYFHQLP